MLIKRRRFLSCVAALAATPLGADETAADSRRRGLLIGSLIGDALGGPIEFAPPSKVRSIMPDARSWPTDRVVDATVNAELARSLTMHRYAPLRPETAAYGPWKASAAKGTITDDSRHKIVLVRALRTMLREGRRSLKQQDLAREFIRFQPREGQTPDAATASLLEEGLREYRYASRWILGDRNPDVALPAERLWSGVSNCSGQMTLLPLACLFPSDPEAAYRATFEIDFIDAPIARDIVSAINAGLAAVLDRTLDAESPTGRWKRMFAAMRNTDPYRFAEVPYAGRPLHRWLDLADSIVERSGGRPAEAYRLLESEGKPVYYWDAHFTLLVPVTLLKLCQFDPLAAMHLTLDFGHDTDSYAQVLGAMIGAIHGADLFPSSMRESVSLRLLDDFGESVDDWSRTIDLIAESLRREPPRNGKESDPPDIRR